MKTIHKFLKITGLTLFIMVVLCIFTILRAMFGIYYDEMTHLSKEDLQWIEGAKNHPTATFVSNLGKKSSLTITKWVVNERHNPFVFSTGHSRTFEANAWYYYEIIDSLRTLEGSFAIRNIVDQDTLSARYGLGAMFSRSIHKNFSNSIHAYYNTIKSKQLLINDRTFNNCIIVDSLLARNSPHWQDKPLQQMDKFVISKDYGLIYYKLKDGEEFFRQFDEP